LSLVKRKVSWYIFMIDWCKEHTPLTYLCFNSISYNFSRRRMVYLGRLGYVLRNLWQRHKDENQGMRQPSSSKPRRQLSGVGPGHLRVFDEPMSWYAFNTYKSNIVKVYILKRHYIWQTADFIFKYNLDTILDTILKTFKCCDKKKFTLNYYISVYDVPNINSNFGDWHRSTHDNCFFLVHGGWGNWSSWGLCSTSCGIGLQRRDRACDSPWPSKDGNPCFGESSAYEICAEFQCNGKTYCMPC